VLGDSFTEGVGVEDRDRFTDLLEQRYSRAGHRVRFINIGLNGKGPMEYLRALVYVGFRYEPDGILICLYANDLKDSPEFYDARTIDPSFHPERSGWRYLAHLMLPRTYTLVKTIQERRSERLLQERDPVELAIEYARQQGISESRIHEWRSRLPDEWVEAARRKEFIFSYSAHGLLFRDVWPTCLDLKGEKGRNHWRSMAQILDRMTLESREHRMEVALVYVPFYFQYDPRVYERKDNEPWQLGGAEVRREWLTETTALQTSLRKWADRQTVPFLDLTPQLRERVARSENLNYPVDGHWTAEGHHAAAAEMMKWFDSNSIFQLE
jgi:hypothetical protein